MSSPWDFLAPFPPRPDPALLDRYVAELLRWNKAVRLIGPSDPKGAAAQVIDSLLPYYYAPPAFPLLDIGSGAGLPAIPIALAWPGQRILCVEPRTRRASFIRHAARTLGIFAIEVIPARSDEALAANPSLARSFATVTARAVADIPTLLAWAEPFLAEGGRVILGRGGDPAATPPGWRLETRIEYPGLESTGERSVVVFTRN